MKTAAKPLEFTASACLLRSLMALISRPERTNHNSPGWNPGKGDYPPTPLALKGRNIPKINLSFPGGGGLALAAEGPGGLAGMFPEDPAEVERIVEAGFLGELLDQEGGIGQEGLGVFEPAFEQVPVNRGADLLPEHGVEMVRGIADDSR